MAIAGNTYTKPEIEALQGNGREYTTPEPDLVEQTARGLASKVCDFFEAEMRKTIPDFRLTHTHKPAISQADQNAEMAYGFVRDCEREREQ